MGSNNEGKANAKILNIFFYYSLVYCFKGEYDAVL